MNNIFTRIIGLVIATFMIAVFYGLFCTTVDFTKPDFNPAVSAHRAAQNVYGLFGTVSEEVNEADNGSTHPSSIARRIAHPYAVTADVSALLGGKLEEGTASLLRSGGKPQTEPTR